MVTVVWERGGQIIEEVVEIPVPLPDTSGLATKRWLAGRAKATWSALEEARYWEEFDARNPVTAYRRAQGELKRCHEGRCGTIRSYFCLRPRAEGRASDGARFLGVR